MKPHRVNRQSFKTWKESDGHHLIIVGCLKLKLNQTFTSLKWVTKYDHVFLDPWSRRVLSPGTSSISWGRKTQSVQIRITLEEIFWSGSLCFWTCFMHEIYYWGTQLLFGHDRGPGKTGNGQLWCEESKKLAENNDRLLRQRWCPQFYNHISALQVGHQSEISNRRNDQGYFWRIWRIWCQNHGPPSQSFNNIHKALEVLFGRLVKPWFSKFRINTDDPPDSFSPWEILKHDFRGDCFHETETIDAKGKKTGSIFLELHEIDQLLQRIISDPRWTIFLDFVDEESFQLYYEYIAYPVCLKFIRERLLSGYYRRIDAFIWDINMIHEDAFLFNDPSSMIVSEAKALVELIRGQLGETKKQSHRESARKGTKTTYNLRNKRRKG